MMQAEKILAEFLGRILDDRFFASVQITRAFPGAVKPTVLKQPVIAAGIKSIDVDDSSLGSDVKSGTFSVFADIFVPFSNDKTVPEQFVFRICRNTADFNIVSISISEMKADTVSECYIMRAVFKFNNEISFRGDENG